jgi:hypothetical protein
MTALSLRLDRLGPWRFALLFAGVLLSTIYLASGLASAWRIEGPGLVGAGLPLGRDFVAFWSASALALSGAPEAVFDLARLHAAESAAVGAPVATTAWHYPPTFLLAVLPLAELPYVTALALWLVAPLAAFWFVLRRLFDSAALASALLLFPAMALCLVSGQNGVITAALIGGALLAIDARPLLAGVLFGLLTYKPHLAALAFPALAFGRYWQTLGMALATGTAMAALSVLAFGMAPWLAFFGNLDLLAHIVDTGAVPWTRMPTVYAAARVLGFDATVARLLQTAVTAAVVLALCAIWCRRAPLAWRGSALAIALPLATPYAFDYDLVVLVLPIAWLFRDALRARASLVDETLLVAAWASPALFWVIAMAGGPPLMPVLLAVLLLMVWRRVFAPVPAPVAHTVEAA